jgi:hypothetical protein
MCSRPALHPAAAATLHPESRLQAPSAALAGCLRAYYWHDLRPCGQALTLPQRLSHFPPGPYNGLVWMLSGEARLIDCGGQAVDQRLPAVFVAGAHRHPYRSVAVTPYCSFGLAFQPAALALLSGVEMGQHVDRISDARALLPADWMAWLDEVAQAPDHAERMAACERFLVPRWAALSRRQPGWCELAGRAWHHAARAPLVAAWSWTQRHFQRRTKQLVGLTPGEVERLLRLERALLDLRDGRAGAADAAAQYGFSDQPHFNRETKAIYQRSPVALVQHLAEPDDDADWLLRL